MTWDLVCLFLACTVLGVLRLVAGAWYRSNFPTDFNTQREDQ